ncbi:MAG: imidazolonepropionase-like amidohydrolase [Cyclobacteriaceae bacterium]
MLVSSHSANFWSFSIIKITMIRILFVLTLFSFGCATELTKTPDFDLLIRNVHIVDAVNDTIIPNQWIAVTGNTISQVGSMEEEPDTIGADVIEGAGDFIMPGLWDNHIHFRGGDSLITENKALIPHFISHGITTVREAGGDITPTIKTWQKEIAASTMEGPRIFTSGPKLDGDRPAWAGSISVTNSTEVANALDSLQAIGIDYVKTYDGSLTDSTYYEILRQTEERGLKVTGHMPLTANLREAIAQGLDGTEHLYYLLKACSPLEDSLTRLGLGYGMMGALVDSYDSLLAFELFSQLADAEVIVTPTLYIGKVLGGLAMESHQSDSMLQYMGPGIQKTYEGRIRSAKRNTSTLSRQRDRLGATFRSMIKPLQDAGVSLLAGSDCGPYNSFVYPGTSLHSELEELVAAGLTPAEALRTSFVNGPKFVNQSSKYGRIEKGKVADLVLLRSSPLEDIRHTMSIRSVILQGKVMR